MSNSFIGTAFNVETNLLIGAAMVETNFDNNSSLGGRSARILISLLDNNCSEMAPDLSLKLSFFLENSLKTFDTETES